MSKEVILGFVRHVLTFGGGIAATEGVATADEVTAIVGGVVALVAVIWSAISKK